MAGQEFADLREELAGVIDETWSEAIRHLPMNGADRDRSRPIVEFQAVLRTGEREAHTPKFGSSNIRSLGFAASGGCLKIDLTSWPELNIRQDDKFVALDRKNEPVFLAETVDHRSHHRLIVHLGDTN